MDLPPDEVQYEAIYISDDDSATVITTVTACTCIAFTAVILRLISRRLKHVPLQNDDYAAIVAMACTIGLSAIVGVDIYDGLGKHTILSHHVNTFAKSITATQILYIVALIPTKLSVIFFYRRLSTSPRLSVILWLLGIWVIITSIVGTLITAFDCSESSIFTIGEHCVDHMVATLLFNGQNVLTNFILLCWPFQYFWTLELGQMRKAHLVGVLVLGGFACAASIIRLVALTKASPIDTTWSATASTIWSVVELTMALTASSLATLTPLLRLAHPKHSTSSSSTTTYQATSRRRGGGNSPSFFSDAETAIATPQLPSSSSYKQHTRTRTISFKEPSQSRPSTSATSKSWQWPKYALVKNKGGADSPGFTWRCSGQPWDLDKWKALPAPPLPVPVPPLPKATGIVTTSPPAAPPRPLSSLPPGLDSLEMRDEKKGFGNAELVFGPGELDSSEIRDEKKAGGGGGGGGIAEMEAKAVFGPDPLFRPVIYGQKT